MSPAYIHYLFFVVLGLLIPISAGLILRSAGIKRWWLLPLVVIGTGIAVPVMRGLLNWGV